MSRPRVRVCADSELALANVLGLGSAHGAGIGGAHSMKLGAVWGVLLGLALVLALASLDLVL